MPSRGPAFMPLACLWIEIGLITLDAHFDMRDLERGLGNGNPVRALIEDGLPGSEHRAGRTRPIRQFAGRCIATQSRAGNLVVTIGDIREAASLKRSTVRSTKSRIATRWWSIATST